MYIYIYMHIGICICMHTCVYIYIYICSVRGETEPARPVSLLPESAKEPDWKGYVCCHCCRPGIAHHEYTALAKKTSAFCEKLCYHLLHHSVLVPQSMTLRIVGPAPGQALTHEGRDHPEQGRPQKLSPWRDFVGKFLAEKLAACCCCTASF